MRNWRCWLFGHNLKPPRCNKIGAHKYIAVTECYRCKKSAYIQYWKTTSLPGIDVIEYKEVKSGHGGR